MSELTTKTSGSGLTDLVYEAVSFIVFFAIILWFSNTCYTTDGVEAQLKADHPEISRVLYTTRNILSASRVEIITHDNEHQTYCLKTNLLFNYRLERCNK